MKKRVLEVDPQPERGRHLVHPVGNCSRRLVLACTNESDVSAPSGSFEGLGNIVLAGKPRPVRKTNLLVVRLECVVVFGDSSMKDPLHITPTIPGLRIDGCRFLSRPAQYQRPPGQKTKPFQPCRLPPKLHHSPAAPFISLLSSLGRANPQPDCDDSRHPQRRQLRACPRVVFAAYRDSCNRIAVSTRAMVATSDRTVVIVACPRRQCVVSARRDPSRPARHRRHMNLFVFRQRFNSSKPKKLLSEMGL